MKRNIRNREGDIIDTVKYSKEDHDLISKLAIWKSGNYFLTNYNGKNISIHRLIMGDPEGREVDHINFDTSDNRRENLRVSTHQQNTENVQKKILDKTTSIYKGVSCFKGKFRVKVTIHRKAHYVGTFNSELEAAKEYDKYIIRFNRNCKDKIYHNLNFSEESYSDEEISQVIERKIKSSPYYGVCVYNDKYISYVTYQKKRYNISSCSNEIEAAKNYDKFVVKNKFDKPLNFKEDYAGYIPDLKTHTFFEEVDEKTYRLLLEGDENVLIDKCDYNMIKHLKCHIKYKENGKKYVECDGKIDGIYGEFYIHRLILNVSDSNILVDHINSDGLDNRRCNLRLSDTEKNPRNKVKQKNTTSKFIGVSKRKTGWVAYITHKHKRIYIGSFSDEREAALKRDEYIEVHFPDEHYKLNFQ